MGNIKIGQTAFIRVTQEPCFLLDIREGNATQKFPGLSGQVAVVRRPTAGENGVRHDIEFFAVEELETLEESQNRAVSEMSEMKARFKASGQDTPAPVGAADELPKWD